MRVLHVTADYPPDLWSGIGASVERQARALADLGVEVHVLVAGPVRSAASHPRLHVHSLRSRRCPVDPMGFDVVHLHSLSLSELALEICRRSHASLVYTAHSLVHFELSPSPHAAFWCSVQESVLSAADHIILLSAAERSAALAINSEIEPRCSVLPHGLPPPRGDLESSPNGPIVFAGRFTRTKGIDLLAEIIPRVLARRHVQFVVAGGHGDAFGEQTVSALRARFPSQCRVTAWMRPDEVYALFARAALVLVPSRYEPFGLTALEAMWAGAPVLASAVGGLIEVVEPGSGGLRMRSRDPARWSEVVLELLSRPALLHTLRSRGPSYVAQHFSAAQLAQRLADEVYTAHAC